MSSVAVSQRHIGSLNVLRHAENTVPGCKWKIIERKQQDALTKQGYQFVTLDQLQTLHQLVDNHDVVIQRERSGIGRFDKKVDV